MNQDLQKRGRVRTRSSRQQARARLAGRALGFLAIAQDLIDAARELSESADEIEASLTQARGALQRAIGALSPR
jgi:hypothetical protein